MSFLARRGKSEDDGAYVSRLLGTYFRLVDANSKDREREQKNWKIYSGVNDGQWDEAALELLRNEDRPAHTFNLVQGAIDMAAGTLKQNPYKTRFDPIDPIVENQVNLAQWLYDFEHDRGGWGREEMMMIVSGLIYRGVAQYFPDYSDNNLGNVGWKTICPWNVNTPRSWNSYKIKDLNYLTLDGWMDADQIAATYQSKEKDVMQAVEKDQIAEKQQWQPDEDDLATQRKSDLSRKGQYRVIETYFQQKTSVSTVYDLSNGKPLAGKPQNILDMAVQKDPQRYKKVVDIQNRTRVVTICPGLSATLILAEGDYPLQLGALPFHFWSAKNLFGEAQGMVDKLRDAQEVYNKRQSSLTNYEAQVANGSHIGDLDYFSDENERNNIKENLNKPGNVFWASGQGRGVANAIIPVPMPPAPTYLTTGSQEMIQLMDRLSNANSALAPSQGNPIGNNGKHYTEILAQSLVPFETLNQFLEAVWDERAAGFIPAAQYIYAGVERRLKSPKSTKALVVNQRVPYGNGANWSQINDIQTLSRYDWTITASEQGTTKKQQDMADIRNTLQLIKNPLLASAMELKLISYGDWSEEAKAQMEADGQLFLNFQRHQMRSQATAMDAQGQQAQMQIQQASNPQQQPPQGAQQPQPPQMTPPADASTAASGPGMGPIPGAAGLAGNGNGRNNGQAPSDMGGGVI